MATIATTQLSNSLATIVAAKALGYLKANTVMAQLVARDWDNEVARFGQSVAIPFTGALSVNTKTEGSAVTLQTPSDSKVTVTLNKWKEVSFLIEDLARTLSTPNYLDAYMTDGLAVLCEQIDGDLTALYSTFSQTVAALTANGGLKESDFREARRQLNAAKAPL